MRWYPKSGISPEELATVNEDPSYRIMIILFTLSLMILSISISTFPVFAESNSVAKLVDFEDISLGTAIFNQYDGVTFIGGDILRTDGSHPITVIDSSVPTVSPRHVLQSHFDYFTPGCEGHACRVGQSLQFDVPQHRVILSTGLASGIPFNTAGYTLRLRGYIDNPFTSHVNAIADSIAPCLGAGPTPITTPLEIDDSLGRINFARLDLVKCNNLNDFPDDGAIIFDNILYDRPLHPPVRETNPPIITDTFPKSGSTIKGSTPGLTSVTMNINVTETAIYDMTAQVNGHPTISVSFHRLDPHRYSAFVNLDEKAGLINGTNRVVLTTRDFDRPQNRDSKEITFNFVTPAIPPPSKVDIWPTAVEVTQSIDDGPRMLTKLDYYSTIFRPSLGGIHNIPLLQNKYTLIRVYGATSGAISDINGVPASMTVYRDNCSTNCLIASARDLPPMSGFTTPNTLGITLSPVGTPRAVPNNIAPQLSNTWNFLLQPQWTTQDLMIVVNINDGNYANFPHTASIAECQSTEIGTCDTNNAIEFHLHFQPAPPMIVDPVYIHVTGTYNGKPYNDVKPKDLQVDSVFALLNELYPANVVRGTRYDITVDPGINKGTTITGAPGGGFAIVPGLLDKVRDKADSYNIINTNEFYLGLFPGDQGTFAANERTGSKQVVGYARVGDIGAWANVASGVSPAHELGHNIGFDHWGCEDEANDDECPVFPIRHGGTDVYGTDIANWVVIPPGDPAGFHAHDMMIPCVTCNNWISWYDYETILNHFSVGSYDTDDPPALLISGLAMPSNVNGKNVTTATLRPLYGINVTGSFSDRIGPEDDSNEIYSIEGFDGKGNVLFVHNFDPPKLDEHSANYSKIRSFDEVVPIVPNLERLSVLNGTQTLGTFKNPSPGQRPSVNIISPASGSIWPAGSIQTIRWTSKSPTGAPLFALVQYSANGGKTFIPLERDIKGNELTVNADELPGNTSAFVYVEVSDGMNTASAKAGPFTVKSKPPIVQIVAPKTNSTILAHVPFTLKGTAFDRQESLLDKQFVWSSNLDGMIGTDREITPLKLRAGEHTITLTVTDSHGLTGSDSIHLNIQPVPAPVNSSLINKWGSAGAGIGQFSNSTAIATDNTGNVYVADSGNHRVQKFTKDGNFITKWDTIPWAIAADSSGNVYVTDTSNHRVEKFTSDGKFIMKWGSFGTGDGQFDHPESIAVDPTGRFVYVADDNKHVQKFDSNGNFITKWGTNGTGNGQFYADPQGLAVDSSGNVYVADTFNFRIQKFDSNGNFITKWGKEGGQPGSGDGEFALSKDNGGPHGIAIDHEGNVYVADTGNNRIQKFSIDGSFIAKWGTNGTGNGQFSGPKGVAVDRFGNVYVADSGNHRIQVFIPPP